MGPNENRTQVVNEEIQIDLQKLLLAYLHRWYLPVIFALIGGVAVLAYTFLRVTPMYRASVTLYVNNRSQFQLQQEYVSGSDLSTAQKLVQTYITITTSDRVMSDASEELGGAYTAEQLKRMITAAQMNQTEVFALYVTAPDPQEAARIANVMADVVPKVLSSIIEGSSARVIDYARVPKTMFSPSYSRNALVGALVGLVLALGYLTLDFLMDVRIKDEEELEGLLEYPVLGQIPDFAYVGRGRKKSGKGYGYAYKSHKPEGVVIQSEENAGATTTENSNYSEPL